MIVKIYGVDGMLEWHALIPAGNQMLNLEFSEGKVSGYGTSPARYRTMDPVVQRAIEASPCFKSGRIRLLETIGSNTSIKRNAETAKRGDEIAEKSIRIINAADLGMARSELMAATGVPASAVRTRAEIESVAKSNGIKINFAS